MGASKIMQNVIRLANGGTVRINTEIWEMVQRLSVDLTIILGRPIKESTVIQILLTTSLVEANAEQLARFIEE